MEAGVGAQVKFELTPGLELDWVGAGTGAYVPR